MGQIKKRFGVAMNIPEGYFIGIDKDKVCTYCWNGKE